MEPQVSDKSDDDCTFIMKLKDLINDQDIAAIAKAQQTTLQRLEKSNEMLLNCNRLSARELVSTSAKFQRHTKVLEDMRNDLQSVHLRIRSLRTRLSTQYPGQFSMALESDMQNVASSTNSVNEANDQIPKEMFDAASESYFSKDNES